ncbi:unnamed protein product, partial [marine sediment metagenome]
AQLVKSRSEINKMKICHITPFFPPSIGGEEKCVFELAKGEEQRGHNVTVITSNIPACLVSQYPFTVIKVKTQIISGMLFSYELLPILKRTIPKNDIIHVHFPPVGFPEFGSIFSLIHSKPFILHIHLFPEITTKWGLFLPIYLSFVFKWMSSKASKIIVPTKIATSRLITYNENSIHKIQVIPYGVDNRLFYPSKKIRTNKFKIVFIGRLHPQKRVDRLLLAISKLKRRDFSLEIYGDGKAFQSLFSLSSKMKIQDRVK